MASSSGAVLVGNTRAGKATSNLIQQIQALPSSGTRATVLSATAAIAAILTIWCWKRMASTSPAQAQNPRPQSGDHGQYPNGSPEAPID